MQSVTPGFTAACTATVARPVSRIEVNWATTVHVDDAWGAAGWTDETDYLAEYSYELHLNAAGSDELVRPGDVGTASVRLWNADGRYSWKRTDSPLYPYIGGPAGLAGKLVRLYQGWEVTPGVYEYVRVFTGPIYDARENGDGSIELALRDMGFYHLQNKLSSLVFRDQRPDQWIQYVAQTLLGLRLADLQLDSGLYNIPFCWLDDEPALDEIWETARADGGNAYFDQLGRLRFECVTHWLAHQTVWDYSEDRYSMPEPAASPDDLATQVTAEWAARTIAPVETVYTLDVEKTVRPGQTLEWEARFGNPVLALRAPEYRVLAPGGLDLAASVTLTQPAIYGQKCLFRAVNNHPTLSATFAKLALKGVPLQGGPTEQVTYSPTPAPLPFARVRQARGNAYVQTPLQAQGLATACGERGKRLRPLYTLREAPGLPQLELGDRVTAEDRWTWTGALTGYVTGISGRSSASGFTQNVQLLDGTDFAPAANIFFIGVSALGAHAVGWY
jgi:hypothetical protein